MARSELRRTDDGLNDVDEHAGLRQRDGAGPSGELRAGRSGRDRSGAHGRSAADHPGERARARELLVAEFFWSEPAPASSTRSAPSDLPPASESVELAAPARRTIVITGRGAERYGSPRRGYEARLRVHERSGFKPDRVAMWAVLLGLALLLGAATSSHAATLIHGAGL